MIFLIYHKNRNKQLSFILFVLDQNPLRLKAARVCYIVQSKALSSRIAQSTAPHSKPKSGRRLTQNCN